MEEPSIFSGTIHAMRSFLSNITGLAYDRTPSRYLHKLRRRGTPRIGIMEQYGYRGDPPTEFANDLEKHFWTTPGQLSHKWHHYFGIYDTWFGRYRGTPVRMLEIGVMRGGSLHMWRDYFGAEATIFGIDIDPSCADLGGDHAQVRIGSQIDPAFLADVVEEMGGLDIVLDDGSHDSRHMRETLGLLFPRLAADGIYMVEDTHTSYWKDHFGGYRWPFGFLEHAKTLIDDLHHWYHGRGMAYPDVSETMKALHFYDSVVVIEKQEGFRPRHSRGPA